MILLLILWVVLLLMMLMMMPVIRRCDIIRKTLFSAVTKTTFLEPEPAFKAKDLGRNPNTPLSSTIKSLIMTMVMKMMMMMMMHDW